MLNKPLSDVVSRKTEDILNREGVFTLKDFFQKVKGRSFWEHVSEKIGKKDRIKLEKLLLEYCNEDGGSYYYDDSYENEEAEKSKRERLIRYTSIVKADGNLRIQDKHFIYSEFIQIDRLSRTIKITIVTNKMTTRDIKMDIPCRYSERFFRYLENQKIQKLHAFGEFGCTEDLVLKYSSGRIEEFGPHIMNTPNIKEFLNDIGLDLELVEKSLIEYDKKYKK